MQLLNSINIKLNSNNTWRQSRSSWTLCHEDSPARNWWAPCSGHLLTLWIALSNWWLSPRSLWHCHSQLKETWGHIKIYIFIKHRRNYQVLACIYMKVTCTGIRHCSGYGAGGDGSVPVHDLLKFCLAQWRPGCLHVPEMCTRLKGTSMFRVHISAPGQSAL